jgi:hypothetical protein
MYYGIFKYESNALRIKKWNATRVANMFNRYSFCKRTLLYV